MAATGYTPIQLYYSSTAATLPLAANLASGELAINIQDEKLYFKNAAGTVKLLASNATANPVTTFSAGTTGFTPSTATSGAITLGGTLATTNGGTGLTSFTANGVVYASSTSALATGSALTWNGTTFGVSGASVNTAGDNVDYDWLTLKSGVSAGNKKAIVWQDAGGTTLGRQYLTYTSPSASFVWGSLYNGGVTTSDLMTLTPTGLGIGTSSPAYKLHVYTNSATASQITAESASAGVNAEFIAKSTAATWRMGTNIGLTGGQWEVYGGSTPSSKIVLDSSGNLGLGVTPSAGWSAPAKAFQISGLGSIAGYGSNELDISTNLYYSGAYKYLTAAAVASYQQVNGQHQWFYAPSGTINSTISLIQAMTLDASGNLMVGSTSVTAGTRFSVTGNNVCFSPNTAGKDTHTFSTGAADVGTYAIKSNTTTNVYLNAGGDSYFNGGNLLVGTTTAAAKLTIASTTNPALALPNIAEIATVSATAATGTINYDLTTQSVLYYTTSASANWTLNVRGNSGLTLNAMMATGQSMTLAFLNTNGATAYYASAFTIDGTSVTPKWQGGTAPAAGNASAIDSYVYTIIKTGSAAYTVLAAQTKFA